MSEQWIILLERVEELRRRAPTMMAVFPDRVALGAAFNACAEPIEEVSRALGADQQECIATMIDEIRADTGIVNRADDETGRA